MRYATTIIIGIVALCVTAVAMADSFGSGANQFTIDFVTISGDSGDLGSWPAGDDYTFTGASRSDYRMGTFEITNDQWTKFKAELGVPVTGDPSYAYDEEPSSTDANVPTTEVSWYEAAQFVNWLNTSTGHQAAYRFTGTQGTGDYALATWNAAEADGTNLYRHRDAFYFLPTEDEWVKAGYWNGHSLQQYTTPDDTIPIPGLEANYNYALVPQWEVGSGSTELNGTFDMIGNVFEWTESPYLEGFYGPGVRRSLRGGAFNYETFIQSTSRIDDDLLPSYENNNVGFRVASAVPEPATMILLALGGVAILKRRNK